MKRVILVSGGIAAAVGLLLVAVFELSRDTDAGLGKLAYVRDGYVWVKTLPDGQARQITTEGNSFSPQWSPSGEWLSLVTESDGGSDSLLMRADGSDVRALDGLPPSWSPREDRIAYKTEGVLVVEDADGSRRRELTPPYRIGETPVVFGAFWSPDGTWLAYRADNTILLVRPNGSGKRELYRAAQGPALLGWSSDGRYLLVDEIERGVAGVELVAVRVEDGAVRRSGAMSLGSPDFIAQAPDGSALAIVTGAGSSTWQNKRIAVYEPDTEELTYLTAPELAAVSPTWSPDGTQIAYAGGPTADVRGSDEAATTLGERHLWVVNRDGTSQRQLTHDERYRDERPQWSADGSSLLFVRLDDFGQASLWQYQLPYGGLEQLHSGLGPRRLPAGVVPAHQIIDFRGYGDRHIAWDGFFVWWHKH